MFAWKHYFQQMKRRSDCFSINEPTLYKVSENTFRNWVLQEMGCQYVYVRGGVAYIEKNLKQSVYEGNFPFIFTCINPLYVFNMISPVHIDYHPVMIVYLTFKKDTCDYLKCVSLWG